MPTWILDRVAIAAYDRFQAEHGGRPHSHDPVRLSAALAWPRTIAAFSDGRAQLTVLAAYHARAVLRLRPFAAGNEAMACLLTMLFLRLNGVVLTAPVLEKYAVFLAFAGERINFLALARWLRRRNLANPERSKWVVKLKIRDGMIREIEGVRADSARVRIRHPVQQAQSAVDPSD